jgi:hypothetical protein
MALQKINWLQIDSPTVPSGSIIDIGKIDGPLHAGYFENLYISGVTIGDIIATSGTDALNHFTASVLNAIELTGSNLTVKGNFTVLGQTTIVDSTHISLGDNVIELNGTQDSFGGLLVRDSVLPNLISGSLLWDSTNDTWIAGPLGSELPMVLQSGSGTINYLQKSNGQNGILDSRISDNGQIVLIDVTDVNDGALNVSGSVVIKGDLRVEGTTTLIKDDPTLNSLIVSGAMSVVKNQFRSASLSIQNLGTWGDRSKNYVIDCGDSFF